jgi:hypothetical protein
MESSPCTTQITSRPDADSDAVAPTAASPASTIANELENPVMAATIPAMIGWTMGYRALSRTYQPSLGRRRVGVPGQSGIRGPGIRGPGIRMRTVSCRTFVANAGLAVTPVAGAPHQPQLLRIILHFAHTEGAGPGTSAAGQHRTATARAAGCNSSCRGMQQLKPRDATARAAGCNSSSRGMRRIRPTFPGGPVCGSRSSAGRSRARLPW